MNIKINKTFLTLLGVSLFLILTSEKCADKNKGAENGVAEEVKITPINYDFSKDYTVSWQKVDSLNKKGLYKSAFNEVKNIYQLARTDKNYPQVIKAEVHKLKYSSFLEEDDYIQAIYELDSLTKFSEFPLKQISHALTAKIYWGYYSANQYTIMGRTETQDFDNKDVRTWSLRKIAKMITYHRMQSLTEPNDLQRIPLANFKDIVSLYNDAPDMPKRIEEFRPTLYDFLAFDAIEFFKSTEFNLPKADDYFVLNQDALLSNSSTFSTYKFNDSDSLSSKYYAIKLLQDLEAFHLQDADPKVLIDAVIQRLNYVYYQSNITDKDKKYIALLGELCARYESSESVTELIYLQAQWYNNNVNAHSENEKLKWGHKTAHQLCEKAIKLHPKSYGAKQCKALKTNIEVKNISFSYDKNISANTYHKFLMSFKNVDTVHFKLLKFDNKFSQTVYYNQKQKVIDELLREGKEVKTWKEVVPNKQDFAQHSLEIVLGPMDFGKYALVACSSDEFKFKSNATYYGFMQVTNFAMSAFKKTSNQVQVKVYNRVSGQVVPDVKVQFYSREYNRAKSKYEFKKHIAVVTNKRGVAAYKTQANLNLYAELTKGADFYSEGDRSIRLSKPYHYKKEKDYTQTFYFLDRKIYRPGQTVYFKGIMVLHKAANGENNLIKNKPVEVTFKDANYQKVKTVTLKTNEYGSFSGSFIAPESGMNGTMSIGDKYNSVYFSVEEYKRPKFEVRFEPLEGVYKLNQKINVVGNANAFAGNVIDGATVKYRVTRSARMPYWCYYRYGYMPQSASVEVASGETTTDANGAFEVPFFAKEDPSILSKFQPTYSYTISADVTDLNGETRSNTTYVSVGYTALKMNVSIAGELDKEQLNYFRITTSNLNAMPVDATVDVKIQKLVAPQHSFRNKHWNNPDIRLYTQQEYHNMFPYDVYDKENKVENFPIEKTILEQTVVTQKNDTVFFGSKNNWMPGTYKVTAKTTDSFGVEVVEEKYVTLFDARHNQPHTNNVLWTKVLKHSYKPNEKAKVLVSSIDDIYVNYKIYRGNKVLKEETIRVNKDQKTITVPVTETDRGGLKIVFTTVFQERNYSSTQSITVPYESRNLQLELATYRNKMLPGSTEEWKMKVKGPKGEKVTAELLVAMYDASLDEFASNYFSMYLNWVGGDKYSYYGRPSESFSTFERGSIQSLDGGWNAYDSYPNRYYPTFNMFGFSPSYYLGRNRNQYFSYIRGVTSGNNNNAVMFKDSYIMSESEGMDDEMMVTEQEVALPVGLDSNGFFKSEGKSNEDKKEKEVSDQSKTGEGNNAIDLSTVKARSNFNETAFFKPHLMTNSQGEVIFSFTMPESLTKWKFLSFGHTQDLKTGALVETMVTQKDLMVVPNAPRFFREGDEIALSAKISNISEKDLTGNVQLFLFDALTNKPMDQLMANVNGQKTFSAKAKESTVAEWKIKIPMGAQAITYKIVAQAGAFSDGEEMTLPVLSNRMLVTESMPLYINKKGTKTFKLDKLINAGSSASMVHERVTLEFTSNPAWYAIQALPYMMEYPYECAEQTFARYYSNAIASNIANSSPKIKKVFDQWKEGGKGNKDAFLSNLEKNQELKSLFLEETPWVLNAKSESENKRRVGLLFDMHRMNKELKHTLKKIQEKQHSSGGWAWFPGMKPSRYITQHIVTGMGHLNFMGVVKSNTHPKEWKMLRKAITYLDGQLVKDYKHLQKYYTPEQMKKKHIGNTQIQYLYARSYFKFNKNKATQEAYDYYLGQAKEFWLTNNLQTEAMTALFLERIEPNGTVQDDIMKSLAEIAIHHEEKGMYYKSNIGGYYWYNAPIETQALLIEAFDVVAKDLDAVNELKVWLLKQKQTTHWKTTKATSEACFALLMRGTELLTNDEVVEVKLGDMKVDPSSKEAGTGYFKESWSKKDVKPEMGTVTVTRKTDGVSWGGFYWQYFEDLDKITPHETPLTIKKQLFKVQLNKTGEYMTPVANQDDLKVSDKVRVRIEIHTDRDLEYVHLKDMRAAGFEPVNVLSRYKWQDGLGYYETTKDASTNFFMDYLSKGSYVFEYDLKVFHKGDFSNGITTMQCMYAPEFTSHSAGVRVLVK